MNAYKYIFLFFFIIPFVSNAQTDVILRRTFIDSLKNIVSYTGNYKIIVAHERPNPADKDGDLHIACLEKTIGLPIVVEIMNAGKEEEVLDYIHDNEGRANKVSITGVWRLWPEHGGKEPQKQGAPIEPYKHSNPDHVFEIHPVLSVDEYDLLNTLQPVKGFDAHEAQKAFTRYGKATCEIFPTGRNYVTIRTKNIPFNYSEFWIVLNSEKQKQVKDGRFIECSVLNKTGEVLVENMRMVFPKNSQAEKNVRDLSKGAKLHVLGTPRVNLNEIDKLLKANKQGMADTPLPVEMIIVGIYK